MIIEIVNFGPIDKFTYDLDKDLIVTYGNNNIGKSYAMQIVYLLLKTLLLRNTPANSHLYKLQIIPFEYRDEEDMPHIKWGKFVQNFIESEAADKDITDEVEKEVYNDLGGMILPDFLNSCENTFGNLEKSLDHNAAIKIKNDQFDFMIDLKLKKITGKLITKRYRLKRTESDFHKSRNFADHLDIYVVSKIEQPVSIIIDQIQRNFTLCLQSFMRQIGNVYFLPASRSGIYSGMNAFGSIVAELSKNRAYFTKKIEFPGISEPISDYFISLSNIKYKLNDSLSEYYSEIEDNILKGKVTFDRTKNALMYKPQNVDAYFEMTEVSSMVSEISPIVAFLKYILSNREKRRKTVLFIEEPEAHLHPGNQIALVEVFTKLINANVKLIISSHSNYVFNKLNNLVLGKKLDYDRYQPIILEETETGSMSKILPIDEFGAEDENFLDVSQQLYYEREEIIQQLNMEE